MILVSQDVEGIRMAALEIFEESMNSADLERRLSRLGPDDPQVLKLLPQRDLADGYYDWALYLLWLKSKMNAGVEFEMLYADEAEGLSALSLAMQDFEKKHPRCACCGERGHSARLCPQRPRGE